VPTIGLALLRIRDTEGGDPRYAALTPAQWCCVLLFVVGLVVVGRIRSHQANGIDPADAFRVTG
jgi:hypothetical protein